MSVEQKTITYGLEGSCSQNLSDQFFNRIWVYTAIGPVWTDITNDATGTTTDVPFVGIFAAVDDILYMGKNDKFYYISINMSTATIAGTNVFEYWNGAAWVVIPWYNAQAGTLILTGLGNLISFVPPDDWAPTSVNGVLLYWVRLRKTVLSTTAGTASVIWCDPYIAEKVLGSGFTRCWNYVSIGAVFTDITGSIANIDADSTMTNALGDITYFGCDKMFDNMYIRTTGAGAATVRVLEYWNGAWVALGDVVAVAGSVNFVGTNIDNILKWTCPEDWLVTSVNGGPNQYWVRSRVTTASTNGIFAWGWCGPIIALSKVITVAEVLNRSFLNVFVTLHSSAVRAHVYRLYRVAVKIGANARSYVLDDTTSFAASGEITDRTVLADLTSYFNSYFGGGVTGDVTVFVSTQIYVAEGFCAHVSGKLDITYECDESVVTKTRTVIFPMDSYMNDSGYTRARSWQRMRFNAIPQLTGAGGQLGESGISIKNIFFEFKNERAAQDINRSVCFWLEFMFDNSLVRSFRFQDLDTTSSPLEVLIFDQNSLSAGSVHELYFRLFGFYAAAWFPELGGLMHVTYTYDHSASSTVNNFVELNLDSDQLRAIGGTDRVIDDFMRKDFFIPEANPVLKISGLLFSAHANSLITLGQLVNNKLGFFDYIFNYDASSNMFSANYAATMQDLVSGTLSFTGYRDRYDVLYLGGDDKFVRFNAYILAGVTGVREWSYWSGAAWTSFHRSFGAVYLWDDSALAFTDETANAASMDVNNDVVLTTKHKDVGDILYVGDVATFKWISVVYGTRKNAGTNVWEYWNGLTWVDAADYITVAFGTSKTINDNTYNHLLNIVSPSDWATTTVNGYTGYFLRLRITVVNTTGGVAHFINSFTDYFSNAYGNPSMMTVGRMGFRLYNPSGWAKTTVNYVNAYWIRGMVVGAAYSADYTLTDLNMFRTHNFTTTAKHAQQFIVQRIDQDSNPLAQGSNVFKFNAYRPGSTGVDGYQVFCKLYLNYQSDKHASGDGRHNRTLKCLFNNDIVSTGRNTFTSKAFPSVGSTWFIQDTNYWYIMMTGAANSYVWLFIVPTAAEKSAYGFNYNSLQSALSYDNIAAVARTSFGNFMGYNDFIKCHADCVNLFNPFSARSLIVSSVGLVRIGLMGIMTLHKIPFTWAGSVSGYAGSGVGLSVEVFRRNSQRHDHIGKVLTTAGGAYSMGWGNNVDSLMSVVRESGSRVGRSDDGPAV